jgi:hypothetical protein
MYNNCPLCCTRKSKLLYSLKNIPIFQNKVYSSIELAKNVEVHNLSLVQCSKCSFIFNQEFVSDIMNYNESYQNEQNYSYFFKEYLDDVIQLFQNKFSKESKIIEIGSGKGYFLDLLENNGFVNVLGFDPAYEGEKKKFWKN